MDDVSISDELDRKEESLTLAPDTIPSRSSWAFQQLEGPLLRQTKKRHKYAACSKSIELS